MLVGEVQWEVWGVTGTLVSGIMWINSSRCKRSPAGLDDAIISTIAALDRSIRMDNSTDSAAENCHKIMAHRSDSRYRESNSTANLRITSHHVSVS